MEELIHHLSLDIEGFIPMEDQRFCILDTDIMCEYKTAESRISDSLIFHNHDGYEIYLFADWGGNILAPPAGNFLIIAT